MPEPSWAGIITAIATAITALGGLALAIAVLIPALRRTQAAAVKTQAAVADLAQVTQEKLGAIEIMSDGALTAALQAEVAAVEAQGVAMRKPSSDTQTAINAIEARLVAMRRALAAREAATSAAHQLIANGAARLETPVSEPPTFNLAPLSESEREEQ